MKHIFQKQGSSTDAKTLHFTRYLGTKNKYKLGTAKFGHYEYLRQFEHEDAEQRRSPALVIPTHTREFLLVELDWGDVSTLTLDGLKRRQTYSSVAACYDRGWYFLFDTDSANKHAALFEESDYRIGFEMLLKDESQRAFVPVDIFEDCILGTMKFSFGIGSYMYVSCVLKLNQNRTEINEEVYLLESEDPRGTKLIGFSNDGSLVLGTTREEVVLWDAKTGYQVANFAGRLLAYSSSLRDIAIEVYDRTVIQRSPLEHLEFTNKPMDELDVQQVGANYVIGRHEDGKLYWYHDHGRIPVSERLAQLQGISVENSSNNALLRHPLTRVRQVFEHDDIESRYQGIIWESRGDLFITAAATFLEQ